MPAKPKITQAMVDFVMASTLALRDISAEVGLSKSTCSKIRNGKVFATAPRPPRTTEPHVPLEDQTEEQLFMTKRKKAAVAPSQIPAIVMRCGSSVFDLGMMA